MHQRRALAACRKLSRKRRLIGFLFFAPLAAGGYLGICSQTQLHTNINHTKHIHVTVVQQKNCHIQWTAINKARLAKMPKSRYQLNLIAPEKGRKAVALLFAILHTVLQSYRKILCHIRVKCMCCGWIQWAIYFSPAKQLRTKSTAASGANIESVHNCGSIIEMR